MNKGMTDMTNTLTTITIHISHDTDIINLILTNYPDFQINLNSNPYETPITASKNSLIPFLLDYYYDNVKQIIVNHPQITQSDIDAYM